MHYLLFLIIILNGCYQPLISRSASVPSTPQQAPTSEAYNARMLFFYSPRKQGDICLYDLQYTLPSGSINTQSLLTKKSFTHDRLTNVLNDSQNNEDYVGSIINNLGAAASIIGTGAAIVATNHNNILFNNKLGIGIMALGFTIGASKSVSLYNESKEKNPNPTLDLIDRTGYAQATNETYALLAQKITSATGDGFPCPVTVPQLTSIKSTHKLGNFLEIK